LIFVEVALTEQMPTSITSLLLDDTEADAGKARWAVFYSISNCQPGLRGVSLGNFLIKEVCERLNADFQRRLSFCTISPVPGFVRWLRRGAVCNPEQLPDGAEARVATALIAVQPLLDQGSSNAPDALERADPTLRNALLTLCAAYISCTQDHDPSSDPVAKFHLRNGAELYRINFGANRSERGVRESLTLMVNYRYDLRTLEDNDQAFAEGRVAAARQVRALI
jgi:malonyl-CoA decarboxylase